MPPIGSGDCPDRSTCVARPEDSTGALRFGQPETAVAIPTTAPVATEFYQSARSIVPRTPKADFAVWPTGFKFRRG
jgi:hypothetical protein